MEKITPKQIQILQKNVENMAKSDEQFLFMLFKNKDGTDNITEYSFNMVQEKIGYYLKEALKNAQIRNDTNLENCETEVKKND